jgi:muramoyltetrapeptide carboxypeptidase LdcA involved in peptidoglycan recycling
MSPLSEWSFRQAAFETAPIGELPPNIKGWTDEHLDWGDPANQNRPRQRTSSPGIRALRGAGTGRGHLIGGCAEVLEMLKGSAWWPPISYWDGAILFYETSEEAPAETHVRRWLRNFATQGILPRLAGILLARPGGGMSEQQREAQYAAVLQVLDEAGLVDLPVLADLDIGHTDPIATLPYGVMAEIDCDAATLRILEAAVTH